MLRARSCRSDPRPGVTPRGRRRRRSAESLLPAVGDRTQWSGGTKRRRFTTLRSLAADTDDADLVLRAWLLAWLLPRPAAEADCQIALGLGGNACRRSTTAAKTGGRGGGIKAASPRVQRGSERKRRALIPASTQPGSRARRTRRNRELGKLVTLMYCGTPRAKSLGLRASRSRSCHRSQRPQVRRPSCGAVSPSGCRDRWPHRPLGGSPSGCDRHLFALRPSFGSLLLDGCPDLAIVDLERCRFQAFRNELRLQARTVVDGPRGHDRLVEIEEVSDARAVSAPNRVGRNIVTAGTNSVRDALDGQIW